LGTLAPPSEHSCNEYTDHTLSVRRSDGEVENWTPTFLSRGQTTVTNLLLSFV